MSTPRIIPTRRQTDDAAFLSVFNRLAVALREPQDGSGITVGVYFDALRDLPQEAVLEAARALSREPGRKFFPTTAEWRDAALKAAGATLRKSLAEPTFQPRGEAWHHDCARCEDTGWEVGHTCPGDETCGRRGAHRPHTYTRACPCRATNPTYLRHHHVGGGAS